MADDDYRPLGIADPSPLTTSALLREIANLKEYVITRFEGVAVRIEAMDKAMMLFQEDIKRVPTDVQKEVGHLKELHGQMFADLHGQLRERSDRRMAEKASAQDALDAALTSAKELAAVQDSTNATAIQKSQDNTEKQIDGLKVLVSSGIKTLDDKIAVINGRLDRGETGSGAARDAVREHIGDRRLDTGMLISVGLFLIAAATVAIAVIKL